MMLNNGNLFLALPGLGVILAAVMGIGTADGQDVSKRKLTKKDVVDMASVGLGDNVILEKIRNAPETDFVTDMESLKALKAAHVSDQVIRLMINPKAVEAPGTATGAAPATPDVPDDVGVYIKVRGKLNEVAPEVVGYRSGGVMKTVLTDGLDKGHRNGTVQGPKSTLQVGSDAEFIVRCAEGAAITEYQLLRLDMKGDRREFRAWAGGRLYFLRGGQEKGGKDASPKGPPPRLPIHLPPPHEGAAC